MGFVKRMCQKRVDVHQRTPPRRGGRGGVGIEVDEFLYGNELFVPCTRRFIHKQSVIILGFKQNPHPILPTGRRFIMHATIQNHPHGHLERYA